MAGIGAIDDRERVRPDLRRRVVVGHVVVFALLAAALWFARWTTEPSHGNADVFYYARSALTLAGEEPVAAADRAAAFTFTMVKPGVEGTYTPDRLEVSSDPRYAGFFRSRLVHPVVAAALVPLLGVEAVIASAAIAAVVAGLAVGLFAWRVTGAMVAGLTAVTLLFLLPSGKHLAWVTTDGWVIAVWSIGLVSAALYVIEGRRRWLAGTVAALVLLPVTKSADFYAFAAALVGAFVLARIATTSALPTSIRVVAGLGSLPSPEVVGRLGRLALAGVAAAAAVFAAFLILGLPSLTDHVQDLLTQHFRKPDVPNPWLALPRRLVAFFRARLLELPTQPLIVAAAALAALAVVRRREPWALLLATAAVSTAFLVVVHPVRSDIDRLLAPAWVSAAIGLAVPVGLWARARAGRPTKVPAPSVAR